MIFFAVAPLCAKPLTGYVIHFDFLENAQQARQLLDVARKAGAQVINVVPPAHVWDRPDALSILDDLVREIGRYHLKFVFTRIDASFPPDKEGERYNFLYAEILNQPGRLSDGTPTIDWFLTTAGVSPYERWMEDETRFYAKRYGSLANLIGINLGPFSEPFVSQRGGFLQFDKRTMHYEITQYTPETLKLWHGWLERRYGNIKFFNDVCGTAFDGWDVVPMPVNETDTRFSNPTKAFENFVSTLNDWFIARYERCRQIWHEESGRKDIPFILQFNGGEPEKFSSWGRAAYSNFTLRGWMDRADALGLSLYMNSGFQDFNHDSIEELIDMVKPFHDRGKAVFVLEGGCEDPTPVLNKDELRYYATVARPLSPVTYIYEFLKDPFYAPGEKNSGRIVTHDGKVRPEVLTFMKALMTDIRGRDELN